MPARLSRALQSMVGSVPFDGSGVVRVHPSVDLVICGSIKKDI